MKKLRNAGIIILCIVLLIVLIGFLLPGKVHVERTILIKSRVGFVFDRVNALENWKAWSPWNNLDSSMEITYEGKSGKGASFSWHSLIKKVGSGNVTITESKQNEFLALELDFGDKGKASSYFRFETRIDSVKVTWGFDHDLGRNPFYRYLGGFMKKMIAESYEKGLNSLKNISEKFSRNGIELRIYTGLVPAANYLAVSGKSSLNKLSEKLGEILPSIMDYLPVHKAQIIGPPIVIYHSFSSESIEFDAAIPFSGELKNEGKFRVIKLPQGNAVIADYYGSYQKIAPAYAEIQNWIKLNSKQINGSPWEEYSSDPSMEKDTSRWLTKIYYPVK
jgi:effector-binding domain-containing protein